MADRIKLRRGPKSKIDLNVYEIGYVTDTNEERLYFNNGSMVPIPNEKDVRDIRAELTETTNVSEQNKKDVLELKENVAAIVKTGVAKLVQYSYDIELSETTKRVNIPYEKYSSVTDTLKVYVNGLAIQNDQYTITDPVENEDIITNGYITLKVERPAGTIVRMEVWKNVPSGEEGEVNGNVIAQNSLPLDRIIGIGDITTQLNENVQNINTHKSALVTDENGVHGLNIESGIFTPTIFAESKFGDNVYNIQEGRYFKINNHVFVEAVIQVASYSNIEGNVRIGGLPFSIKNDSVSTSIGLYENIKLDNGYSQFCLVGVKGQNSLYLVECGSNVTAKNITEQNIYPNTRIKFSVNYEIA